MSPIPATAAACEFAAPAADDIVSSAIIVGSGPNGLAAAARLARAGLDVTVLEASDTIGGGTRSSEMIVPGLVHDHCSAFHPIAAASPFLDRLDLAASGLTWLQPAVDCAHPLDDGSAGVLYRSIDRTAAGMGQGRSAMASSLRADGLAVRRLVRRRIPAGPARAATSVGAGALRHRRDVAGHHAGSALEDGGGQGAVGRRRGACLLSPRPPSDQRGRADADRRRARRGVGGGRRRLAGDRRRLGGRHRTPRRQDRDRSARGVIRRPAAQRCADAGRVAVDRRRHPRRPVAEANRPLLPTIPSRPRRLQSRLRCRRRRSLDRAGRPPCGHGPSRRRSATRLSPTSERCTAG